MSNVMHLSCFVMKPNLDELTKNDNDLKNDLKIYRVVLQQCSVAPRPSNFLFHLGLILWLLDGFIASGSPPFFQSTALNDISSLTQTSLSNTVIDNPQTKAPDEQILQILEYLNSDTVWYVSSVLHFFKLHCVWSVDVSKLLSLI